MNKDILDFRNACVDFGSSEVLVPAPICFQLTRNSGIILIGPNGTGKTTLMNLVYGTLNPSRGEVLRTVNFTTEAARVYQNDALLNNSDVYSNLKIVSDNRDKILSSASEFGLRSHLNKPCRLLSGGQRRVIQFLRVVLSGRLIWLLDEPTAGVDNSLALKISIRIAKHIGNGGCVLCVTHDQRLINSLNQDSKIKNNLKIIELHSVEVH